MKRLSYVCSALLATMLLFSLGCADQPEVVEEEMEVASLDTTAVKAQIDELRNNFMAMVKTGDYSLMQNLAHPEFVAVGPTGEAWEKLASMSDTPYPAGTILAISPMETTVINDTWAFEMGKSQVTFTPSDGSETIVANDTYLMIFKNEGNGFRLYREVATNTLPAMEEEMTE
jgi:hypothetical protein